MGLDVLIGPVEADRTTGRVDLPWQPIVATGWVYILGEVGGADLKIGYTGQATVQQRVREVVDGWNGTRDYVLLVAVRGTKNDEKAMRRPFRFRTDLGNRTEYVWPDENVLGYANWLRSQWFATTDGAAGDVDVPAIDSSLWLPEADRCWSRPADDPDKMVQDYECRSDALAGSAWSWMVNPVGSIQDYFTPSLLIEAARVAMGDIDLDAASHWQANKVHKIPEYFDINRSAFNNPWHGRVWLNPPYGDNPPWFREILRYTGSGAVTQLCMLSPIWAFTTSAARPVMERSSAFVLLYPTPKFWGNSKDRTGTNLPHGILYLGDRPKEFFRAFTPHGYPMEFRWDVLDQLDLGAA